MFSFLVRKTFYTNLFLVSLIISIFVWSIFAFINNYTHHGETISVPSLKGLTAAEASTLEQTPLPDALVKENRTIYLTTTKLAAPKISMPDVIGGSQRMAVAKLSSYGFHLNNPKYKVSEYSGTILGYEINGKKIEPGDYVDEMASVTLIIGKGKGNDRIMVPSLIGLTLDEAQNELQSASLNMGFKNYTNCGCITPEDTSNAKIYKQQPIRSERIALYIGSSVDLYFTCDTNQVNNSLLHEPDSLNTDTMPK